MRFISRGCDLDGNASNTAETEQIVSINKKSSSDMKIFSHVQWRGSIPLIWQQKPSLKWEPKVAIPMESQNVEIARKHFEKFRDLGKHVLINLIDKKKNQLRVGEEFKRTIEKLNDSSLRFIWFDFHHECRKMKYENLSKLMDQMEQEMKNYGYLQVNTKKGNFNALEIVTRQTGTFRTNCMDCLDRTNVVQSVIARRFLWKFIQDSEISTVPAHLAAFEKFPDELEKKFRDAWTKNANVLSILYTGTDALKTDFTKTGKRTKKGALQDGKNSLVRYVKNNFYDGYNQNCIDLVLGKYKPREKPYKKRSFNNWVYLVSLMIIVPIMMKFILDTLDQEIFIQHHNTPNGKMKSNIFYYTVFGLSIFMIFKAITSNAQKFIEKPVVNQ